MESCQRTCISVQVELGSGYGLHEHSKRPADVLAANWMLGKLTAFNFTVTSSLVPNSLPEASVTARSAAFASEEHKHRPSDAKCAELASHLQWRRMVAGVQKLSGHYLSLLPVWAQDRTVRSP